MEEEDEERLLADLAVRTSFRDREGIISNRNSSEIIEDLLEQCPDDLIAALKTELRIRDSI